MRRILNLKTNSAFIVLVFLFGFILVGTCAAQNVQPKDVVDIKASVEKDSSKTNGLIYAEIILNIKDGWHINADEPLDQYLTPTKVVFKDLGNIEVEKIKYPPPIMMKLDFSDTDLVLYEDQTIIEVVLKIKDIKKTLDKSIQGELQFQPCNNQTCLFPVSKPFKLILNNK